MPIIENINELNERITFQEKKANEGPEPGSTIKDLFSCWAKVRTQNIKDVKLQHGTVHENTIDFVVRYQLPEEVTNTMTIKWRGDTYEIININPDHAFKKFTVIVGKKTTL